MQIETARLILIACPAQAAQALLDGHRARAEGLLGAALPAGWPDDELAGILPAYIERLRSDRATIGHGVWVILTGSPRIVVGSAGFVAPPDADGALELGYGVHADHRGNGYATEAAAALVRWGLGSRGTTRVIAECDSDNGASIRVLEKVGMRRISELAGTIRWAAGPGNAAGE